MNAGNTRAAWSMVGIHGYLIGFWALALFGSISETGFHFLDERKNNSMNMMAFSADNALLSYREKKAIEVINHCSAEYKNIAINIPSFNEDMGRVEK